MLCLTGSVDVAADDTKPAAAEAGSLPADPDQSASVNGDPEYFAEVTPVHTKQSESIAVCK